MRILTALAATVLLLTATATSAQADPGTGLALREPSGPYPVGARDLRLVDEDRADPWVPERRRELMITLWYPAVHDRGVPEPYVTAEESRLILARIGAPGLPPELLAGVGTHARTDTPPRRGRHPVVVLSPGFSFPRSSLTGLAEDLASRGYLVVGVDHTYEAAAVTFPDGRVTTCLVCDLVEGGTVNGGQVGESRAADVSFVLDDLAARRDVPADWSRVAMAGHSMGGNAAAQTMVRDRRVDAGVNLDGGFYPAVTRLDRPFLMVGAEERRPGTLESWDTSWANLTGWRRWITVTGTTHSSFTDYGLLGEQAGLPLQTMPGARITEITTEYVAQFAGRHLRGEPAPLLRGPHPDYPEVLFWRP
ncbi:alpha/beta hydrolase family protein [Catenuloplanes atrovinosus]|uniref:Dienelactone hydrolase n=1 Tax=Catenuloplanes atrovinosus TaxID=137266 RepID=A0AAE3YJN9_9ACTN|nr:lipase [Catenuloplanes atrovinosus]MDR7274730.1 putative dienelactone hydrolase [Catenuloplanes atrovinosus]